MDDVMNDPDLWPLSLDALTSSSDHHRVLLENDLVRVVETLILPGETTEIHTHRWPGSLHVVSWTDFVRYDHEGNKLFESKTVEPRPTPGTILWSEPLGPHYVTNVGTEPLQIIATELKVRP